MSKPSSLCTSKVTKNQDVKNRHCRCGRKIEEQAERCSNCWRDKALRALVGEATPFELGGDSSAPLPPPKTASPEPRTLTLPPKPVVRPLSSVPPPVPPKGPHTLARSATTPNTPISWYSKAKNVPSVSERAARFMETPERTYQPPARKERVPIYTPQPCRREHPDPTNGSQSSRLVRRPHIKSSSGRDRRPQMPQHPDTQPIEFDRTGVLERAKTAPTKSALRKDSSPLVRVASERVGSHGSRRRLNNSEVVSSPLRKVTRFEKDDSEPDEDRQDYLTGHAFELLDDSKAIPRFVEDEDSNPDEGKQDYPVNRGITQLNTTERRPSETRGHIDWSGLIDRDKYTVQWTVSVLSTPCPQNEPESLPGSPNPSPPPSYSSLHRGRPKRPDRPLPPLPPSESDVSMETPLDLARTSGALFDPQETPSPNGTDIEEPEPCPGIPAQESCHDSSHSKRVSVRSSATSLMDNAASHGPASCSSY